ncbi:hypothetical protein C1Y63_04720 [Corynebacterium sp. 13CS0277]|uniref:hypothetical protein n=1 Tax=Corynebacterium sp. 13CS0277 TaxID=2071994 RepID=UPI000D03803E|nr:hypothetical protein [Corynebacterium sp. 13CS0277]PRQ11715.1 hypothetical protein C1Y63_04720 [Corynebacterium sp. 13CS0277]
MSEETPPTAEGTSLGDYLRTFLPDEELPEDERAARRAQCDAIVNRTVTWLDRDMDWRIPYGYVDLAGRIDGKHFREYTDTVKQLKREGRLEEALALQLRILEAANRYHQASYELISVPHRRDCEREGWQLPNLQAITHHRNTIDTAIIYRKLKDYDGEIAVLEGYLDYNSVLPEFADSFCRVLVEERLAKARQLKAKAEARQSPQG